MLTYGYYLALLLSVVIRVEGFGPSSYSCNPATCTENCHCPSISAPGGLQGANIPQFVLITHDDAISNLANTVVRSAVDGFKNPNGCNVVATWFTTSTGTECDLAKKLYDENHEIALHTVHHASLGPDFLDMEAEMMNAKKDLMQCGIPEEEMVGFRAPYLVHNPKQRAILAKNKMLYDSSIIESISSRSMTTKNMAERLWPYSMDNGIVQDCTYTSAGTCSSDERYPGLWEVPLWPLLKDDLDKENNAYSMDPGPGFDGDVYQTLVTNFDQSYAGNRAPVPLFTHATWFTDENVAASRKFIEYALSKGDVYFVTIKELLDWMKNPVSAQEYKTKANCKPVNVRPPVKKKCQVYIVQPGDYLASIAGKFGIIDIAELTSINPSLQVKTIQPGERINIPPWDDSCPPSASIEAITEPPGLDEMVTIAVPQPVVNEKQPVEPAMSLQPVEPVQPVQINEQVINQEASIEEKAVQEVGKPQGSTDCQIWTVAQGEFLEGIAKAAGATVQDIIDLNGITVGNTGVPGLSVGQQLKIPPYPECCVSLNCSPLAPLQNAPKTRVDIGLNIMSTSPIQNNAMEQIKAIIAEELDIPAGAISVAVTSRRRGRRLRQATTIPTSVVVSIATTTPVRLKQKITDELRKGDIETMLGGLGYSLNAMPVITAYQNGNELTLPEQPESNSTESTFWTTGVIVGVAVGGSVALFILAGIIISLVVRQKKRSANMTESSGPVSGGMVANVSLRDSYVKKEDPVKVVIGGYDTPTTPRNRTFNQIIKTNNVLAHMDSREES